MAVCMELCVSPCSRSRSWARPTQPVQMDENEKWIPIERAVAKANAHVGLLNALR